MVLANNIFVQNQHLIYPGARGATQGRSINRTILTGPIIQLAWSTMWTLESFFHIVPMFTSNARYISAFWGQSLNLHILVILF